MTRDVDAAQLLLQRMRPVASWLQFGALGGASLSAFVRLVSTQIQFTPEDIRREQEKLLQRMAELGWVSGFGWSDITGKLAIAWTDEGQRRLVPVRVALDSLGCRKADELCALEGLLHGYFIDPSA